MRKLMVLLHRWVGLAILAFVALAAITGTIISFDKELDRWLNEDWYYVQPQGQKKSIDELIPLVEARFPGKKVTNARIESDAASSQYFSMLSENAATPKYYENAIKYHNVFVDPYTGTILGDRPSGGFGLSKRQIIPFVVRLHYTLMLGSFGKLLFGIVALLWLLDHFWAVYLSFPSLKNWRKSFQFRWNAGSHKLNFDMHRSGSMWLLPVLIMLALTSVYLNFNSQFKWVVSQFSPVTKAECTCHVDPNAKWERTSGSWDGAMKLAQDTKPDLTVGAMMYLPDSRKLVVSMKGPGDLTAESGMTKVYVNAVNGELMHVHDRSMETAGDTFTKWMLPLHNGRVFGVLGQIIILLSGIAVTIICITGFLIYAKKAKARVSKKEADLVQPLPAEIKAV